MTYGVELINNYGYQVATINDVNYILRASGQINNSQFSNYGANDISVLSMDVNHMEAPILFHSGNGPNQRLTTVPGGAGNAGRFLIQGQPIPKKTFEVYKWWNLDCGTIQYYIFDRWIPPERSNYGVQIFDGGGGIIFDGGWNFMKLVDVMWVDPGFPNYSGSEAGFNRQYIGGLPGGDLAVAMPNVRYWSHSGFAEFGWRLGECANLDAGNTQILTSLCMTYKHLDMIPEGSRWASQSSRSQIMIADVSQLPKTYNPVAISSY